MNVNAILDNMDFEKELIEIRRTIHENPCVSEHEEETVKFLAGILGKHHTHKRKNIK